MHLSLDDATRPRLEWPDKVQLRWLVGIALVGLLLRLFRLEQWGFWVDEAHTYRDAVMPYGVFERNTRSHYPVAFYLLRLLLEVLPNDSESWVRLPFAFFGAITVPLLGLLAAPMVGARAALVAAGLMAINPWHIYWSQNARFYSLTSLLSVVSVALVYQGLVLRHTPRVLWGVTVALLGGLSHLPVFTLLPAMMAAWWLAREPDPGMRDRRLITAVLVTALSLLLLPVLLPRFPGLEVFIQAKGDASLLHLLQTGAYFFRVPLILTGVVGAWFLWRSERFAASVVITWILVPALFLVAAGTVVKTTSRYVFFVQPALLLLCGITVVHVWDLLRSALGASAGMGRYLVAGILPLLLLADSAAADYLYYTVEYGDRPRWGEAAKLVDRKARKRPTIVATTNGPTMRYYLDRGSFRMDGNRSELHRIVSLLEWELAAAEGGGAGLLTDLLEEARAEGYELFVVTMAPELQEKDVGGGVRRTLEERFRVVGSFPNHVGPRDLTVYVYQPLSDR